MPSPSLQISGFLKYDLSEAISIDLFERYRNRFRRSGVASQVFAEPYVASYATTNLTLTARMGDLGMAKDAQIAFSVTNLFNATPPLSGYYSGTTSAGAAYEFSDDPTGRAFQMTVRVKG
jgi:outer membrane receptor protein involved in Fe transport